MSTPLNEQFRAARLDANLTVAELARLVGTSRAAIHAYETGTRSPTVSTAERILGAMGCTLKVQQG